MNAKERIALQLQGKQVDRPAFCPAIYEHKAKLISKSPSDVCQSADLLEQALLAEYEMYCPDLLTVGIDVYNIEAEALGCVVQYFDDLQATPAIETRALQDMDGIGNLPQVDPQRDGRMPLNIEVCRRLHEKLGNEVIVRGALTGPFSVAAELLGVEQTLMAAMTEPEPLQRLLQHCVDVAIAFGKAIAATGAGVCIFDSQAAPPLLPPTMYRDFVLPTVQAVIKALQADGVNHIEYVVGGNTTDNALSFYETGTNIVLSDFASDVDAFLPHLADYPVLLRRNVDPRLIESGPAEAIEAATNAVIQLWREQPRVIVGTGVLSCAVASENVKLVKQFVDQVAL